MDKKLFALLFAVVLLVGCIAVSVAATDTVATIGTTPYSSLQDAVNAFSDPATPIQLVSDTDQAVTIGKDVYLDLNGFDVTGKVTVTAGTLYCLDSKTNDYDIDDSEGYGQLTDVTGNVAGAPCTKERNGYLMVNEGTSLSFHCVNLNIYAMSLRSEKVGVYYKSYFSGDRLVAANVKNFGIALSVRGTPTAENIATQCKASVFEDFKSGSNDNDSTSTLLKNVMKAENTNAANTRNSKMPIYGRAYILTNEGQYLFGNGVSRDLKTQVELAASDTYWNQENMTTEKKDAAVAMYRIFKDVMQKWEVGNIESRLCLNTQDPLPPANKESLKVLAITSSFGLNTTQLLYDVAVAEGYAPENVTVARLYTSGCTLKKHIDHAPSTPVYQYTKISGDPDIVSEYNGTVGKMATLKTEGNATLLDGLLDEEWDIIFMQQGAREASLITSYVDANGNDYITQLRNIMKPYVDQQCPNARFVWNMLWAFDEGSKEKPLNTVFNNDQMAMYQASLDSTMKYVVPRTDYDRIIPSATAIQNARTSYFGETLSRDTYHLNNLGGTIAAYGLYAVITGQEITEINLDIVAASGTNGIGGAAKITEPFTEKQKTVIMESVNNALKIPFSVTKSQYPPIDYSSYTYTENLRFIGDTEYAVCPACKQEVKWTALTQENQATVITRPALPSGQYHFYLDSNITYTANNTNTEYSFIRSIANGNVICLHLNGHDLTATDNSVITLAGTKINLMGTGTVTGNAKMSGTNVNRGTTLQMNSSTANGIMNIYSGTYKMATDSTNTAVVSGWVQGGTINVYEDAEIIGNGNHSIYLSTQNTKSPQIVNIYGGSISGGDLYFDGDTISSTVDATTFNLMGGNISGGIQVLGNTKVTISGAPKVSGTGLKLAPGTTVTLGELKTGAEITVDATGAFTAPNTNATTYLNYFKPVSNDYGLSVKDNVLYSKSVVYTKNLSFAADGKTAYCPACKENMAWTEVNQTNLSALLSDGTTGYFGNTMPSGTHHFYLSSNISFTATDTTKAFIYSASSNRNICLHLNGNNLTSTNCAVAVIASTTKLNIMGTGTVCGNASAHEADRGATLQVNSGSNGGAMNLYSGTFTKAANDTKTTTISMWIQGGTLNIYEDSEIQGYNNHAIYVSTQNTKILKTLTLNGAAVSNGDIYFDGLTTTDTKGAVTFNMNSGSATGVTIIGNTTATLSGAPVIKGAGLKLAEGTTVTLGTLAQGASIAVDATGAFTVTNTLAADYLKYFSAVQNGYEITEADGVLFCTAKETA